MLTRPPVRLHPGTKTKTFQATVGSSLDIQRETKRMLQEAWQSASIAAVEKSSEGSGSYRQAKNTRIELEWTLKHGNRAAKNRVFGTMTGSVLKPQLLDLTATTCELPPNENPDIDDN